MRQLLLILSILLTLCAAVAQETQATFRARPLAVGERVEIIQLNSAAQATLTIQMNGIVRLPGLGDIQAAGMTPEECAESIRKALSASGKATDVVVRRLIVKDLPVSFRGAFRKAGTLQPWPNATLGTLLDTARPTDRADLEHIEVWSIEGNLQYFDVSYPNSPALKTPIKAGDAIFVPELKAVPQITVLGGVNKPGVIPYQHGITVMGAIEAAGGLMNRADASKVRIERDKKLVDTINLELKYDSPLKAGDVVLVPLQPDPKFVTINGGVKKEGLLDFKEGMTLSDAVKSAGGTIPLADLSKVSIMRRVNGALTRQKVDLNQIRAGKQADIVLQAGDLIDVPVRKPTGPATLPPTGGGGGLSASQEPIS